MNTADLRWALHLRSVGLDTDAIARLLAMPGRDVRRALSSSAYRPSTFVNGRGWV